MPIVNRELDPTEQRTVFGRTLDSAPSGISAGIVSPNVVPGITYVIGMVPYSAQLVSGNAAAFGVSGTLNYSLWIYRYLSTGFTAIPVGQTQTLTGFGASFNFQSASLFAAQTFLLNAGDVLVAYTQGANSAATQVRVECVIRALADFKNQFNINT